MAHEVKISEKWGKPIPFIPNHAITEMAIGLFVVGIILFISGMFPHHQGPMANPAITPAHVRPEWYLLWAFGMLKLIPSKFIGILAPNFVFAALIMVPWLDRSPERDPMKRKGASLAMVGAIAGLIILALVGEYYK